MNINTKQQIYNLVEKHYMKDVIYFGYKFEKYI